MRISSSTQSESASVLSTPASKAMSKASEISPHYVADLAIVSDDILPYQVGRVSFQSSWWPALCQQNIRILAGTTVRIIGRSNITLIVEPLPDKPSVNRLQS
jgi:membrane protein implicated in regulation of membrane protease activity